jgi:WhiB family transcriptional regulator, redox-sensing transcriptional regulator
VSWWDHAACQGRDVEFFFAPGHNPGVKQVCASCPVRRECLADALESEKADYIAVGRLYGVRGGLLPVERIRMLRNEGLRARSEA